MTYRFVYIINGVETPLSEAQSSRVLTGQLLPQGEDVTNRVTVVVDVVDSLKCGVRATLGSDGLPVYINSTKLVVADFAAFAASQSSSLDDSLKQGKVSTVLANVGMLSQMLTQNSDPCAGKTCGGKGTCFQGVCTCDVTSGYTGANCEVAPAPIPGAWSEWSTGPCSVSCGGGTRNRTRVCTPPKFGGAACVGAALVSEACNPENCTQVVHGGWSDWSEWSTCSNACPGNLGGDYSGVTTRVRSCSNPPPSADGLPCPDAASETGSYARKSVVDQCFSILHGCRSPVFFPQSRATQQPVKHGASAALEAATTSWPTLLCWSHRLSARGMGPVTAYPPYAVLTRAAVLCVIVKRAGAAATVR